MRANLQTWNVLDRTDNPPASVYQTCLSSVVGCRTVSLVTERVWGIRSIANWAIAYPAF
jgi:hypothetical protein